MNVKPRRRGKEKDPPGKISGSSDAEVQKSRKPTQEESSEELEYLEVKHVVLILLIVFVIFFIGTFMFFNAISSSDSREKESRFDTIKPLSEHSKKHTRSGENVLTSKTPETSQKSQPTELELPTILWWTDMLYPHLLYGTDKKKIQCDIGSCYSTKNKQYLSASNTRGIIFYGTDFRAYEAPLPRQPWHEWALLHEESPMNNYILSHRVLLRLFNHTGTFRRESHFPITTHSLPSLKFLTERPPVPLSVKNSLRGEKLAPIVYIQSHCNVPSDRDRYVRELMKHVQVDSYGACLHNKELPPHLSDPVESMFSPEFYEVVSKYKFHLAFENAICEDYITEKFFRPFHLGSVPIHMGSSSASDWAPNNRSMINANDFASAKDLAEFIKLLDRDDTEYEKYLEFKRYGIENKLLTETVEKRNWGINEYSRHSFITAFECHVCDRIYERWISEQKHEQDPSVKLPPPRTGEYKHMGCPEPFPSVGTVDETHPEDEYVISCLLTCFLLFVYQPM